MPEEIMRKPEVLAAIKMGNSWLYDAMKRGEFPTPIKLGARAVAWRRSEVQHWLDSRQKRDA